MNLDRLISMFRQVRSAISDEDHEDDNIVEIEAKEESEAEFEGGEETWTEDTITYYSWWFW